MKRILIVDDRPELRTLTKTILSREYEVDTADNGLAAMSILQSGYLPDLIVTDLMMPVMGGKELIEQLKSSGAFNNIPVIVLSSIDKTEEKIALFDLGADDYMEKPYNPAELMARIKKILK